MVAGGAGVMLAPGAAPPMVELPLLILLLMLLMIVVVFPPVGTPVGVFVLIVVTGVVELTRVPFV